MRAKFLRREPEDPTANSSTTPDSLLLPAEPEDGRMAFRDSQTLEERGFRESRALQERQAQLEAIVHSAMDAIVTVDEEQRIVMFNVAAEKMFRCTKQEALGESIERFIPERFRDGHAMRMRKFGDTGATTRAKGKMTALYALRRDGEEFPIEASISHSQINSRMLFTVIMRDITEREKAEKRLFDKMQELARSNAELEQFAYVASHDLQEPLRMVANYTQLLAQRYRGQLDEQADKYVAYAVDGAVRMQALIRDLLKFSRVATGGFEPGAAECRHMVEQAVKNLQAAVEESGAAVQSHDLPVVRADPSQLTQVFQNLIANAIKFRGAEKPVIQIGAEKVDHQWVLSVSDNGIGIPQESWGDIFVIFRRLHTHTEYPGNGIGLSICKKIIERHGGKIWIEAQAAPGCCFKFTLPAESTHRENGNTRT